MATVIKSKFIQNPTKIHYCDYCNEKIKEEDGYHKQSIADSGCVYQVKLCKRCCEFINKFKIYDSESLYDELVEKDYLFCHSCNSGAESIRIDHQENKLKGVCIKCAIPLERSLELSELLDADI